MQRYVLLNKIIAKFQYMYNILLLIYLKIFTIYKIYTSKEFKTKIIIENYDTN